MPNPIPRPADGARRILAFRLFGTMPRLLVQALSPQLVLTLGIRPADVAFVLMVNIAVAIATILAYPALASRFGIRHLLQAGIVLSVAGIVSIAWADSYGVLAAVFSIAGGIGWVLLGLQCPQHLVATLPSASRAANLRAMTSGPLVAGLVIPPAVLWLAELMPWHRVVLGLAALTALVCLLCVPGLPARAGAPGRPRAARTPGTAPDIARTTRRVGPVEYTAIALSGALAGFFTLHFVLIVDAAFGSARLTAIALFASGLTTLTSVRAFARLQEAGMLLRYLIPISLLASALGLASAPFYQSAIAMCCLLAWPALSAGYFMHSMGVAAGYDRDARTSGHLIIVHMLSAGIGAWLFSLAVDSTGSYAWPLAIMASLSFATALLMSTSIERRTA